MLGEILVTRDVLNQLERTLELYSRLLEMRPLTEQEQNQVEQCRKQRLEVLQKLIVLEADLH
jgi:hypothetical protein